jgi:hypothetical protein
MVLDLSVRKQTYVEDCEVCCNPIEISYAVTDKRWRNFRPGLWDDCKLKMQLIATRKEERKARENICQ